MVPIRRDSSVSFRASGAVSACHGAVRSIGSSHHGIGWYGMRGIELGVKANDLGKPSRLKDVKKSLTQGDVDQRIHQEIHKVYSKWMVRVVSLAAD